jgi:alpha-1,3-glucosyltransferase
LSELLFLYGIVRYLQADARVKGQDRIDMRRFAFNFLSAAFIFLDNIHFQYNSMMYGILLVTLAHLKEESYFKSALAYAILLNFKHIFLYLSPCFGIIYLKNAVFNQPTLTKSLRNFVLLAL